MEEAKQMMAERSTTAGAAFHDNVNRLQARIVKAMLRKTTALPRPARGV